MPPKHMAIVAGVSLLAVILVLVAIEVGRSRFGVDPVGSLSRGAQRLIPQAQSASTSSAAAT